ncbi:uncharacterized protein LOC122253333, partial [Penaeus japonicus]|uniref:uncharacterized protein LOC122253333 n=1 Tax=Penaeus japonicus TaxID=27405 RepID=UPI001C710038
SNTVFIPWAEQGAWDISDAVRNYGAKRTASQARQPREDATRGPAADLQREPVLSPESFKRKLDSTFEDLTLKRQPTRSEVLSLTQLCKSQGLPLMSPEQVKAVAEKNGLQFLVGICPEKLCLVTRAVPRKGQTVQAPVINKSKRPHQDDEMLGYVRIKTKPTLLKKTTQVAPLKRPLQDEAEMNPQKKIAVSEQVVLQNACEDEAKEVPQPKVVETVLPKEQEEKSQNACDEAKKAPQPKVVESVLPKEQEKKSQPQAVPTQDSVNRIIPQDKSLLFQDCFDKVNSLVFKGATEVRWPTPEEVQVLTRVCADCHLPVLNRRQFLPSGFQRVVGLCPETLSLVTKFAGRTLEHFVPSERLKPEHRYSAMMQICKAVGTLHKTGLVHNDIKLNNVCLKLTASGPEVTLIDFGICRKAGTAPGLQVEWNNSLPYAPEICGADNCSAESDVYSVGKLLHQLFGSKQLPQLLNNWYVKSQSQKPSERSNLSSLMRFLELQRIADLRSQY